MCWVEILSPCFDLARLMSYVEHLHFFEKLSYPLHDSLSLRLLSLQLSLGQACASFTHSSLNQVTNVPCLPPQRTFPAQPFKNKPR